MRWRGLNWCHTLECFPMDCSLQKFAACMSKVVWNQNDVFSFTRSDWPGWKRRASGKAAVRGSGLRLPAPLGSLSTTEHKKAHRDTLWPKWKKVNKVVVHCQWAWNSCVFGVWGVSSYWGWLEPYMLEMTCEETSLLPPWSAIFLKFDLHCFTCSTVKRPWSFALESIIVTMLSSTEVPSVSLECHVPHLLKPEWRKSGCHPTEEAHFREHE